MNSKANNIQLLLILTMCSFFVFTLISRSRVDYTGGDSRGSLLLSQSLIEYRTIKLDNYKNIKEIYGNKVHEKNGHLYYYFPIGTSLSSIPFVLFETQVLNNSMEDLSNERIAQKNIAGVVSVLILLLLVFIAKMYLDNRMSIGIALLFWLGTSFSSTLGQALWSQDFAALYSLSALYLMLKISKFNKKSYWPLLAFILFMAYLTRPTLSLLSIAVILCIFVDRGRYEAIKIAGFLLLLLGLFVIFSLNEFNQSLPDYYLPQRLDSDTYWTAFFGNLISPSRGIFLFSPFLFIFFLNIEKLYAIFTKNNSLIIIAGWIFLHLIIISRFPHWWAGHSYGPRLMTDVLPPIYLIFIILFSSIYTSKKSLRYYFNMIFLIITIPTSIYFNAYQGLYNPFSGIMWNGSPNIDEYPDYLFDWKYPQFLHNEERHKDRLLEFKMKHIEKISTKTNTIFNSNAIIYAGCWEPEKEHRRSLVS